MEKSWKVLAISLAGFFAILFVLTTALAFALFNAEKNAFNAELYIQALAEERVYQRLPELTAQAMTIAVQSQEGNGLLSLFRNMSEEDWRVFVDELFPPGELKLIAEDVLTQIMAILNGESDQAVLSIARLKMHLGSPVGVSAIYGMLKAQPDCTLEQLTVMALGTQGMVLCSPPDTFLFFDLRPFIEAEIKGAISFLPEQITIISATATKPQNLRNLNNIRTGMRFSPLLPMFCLFAIIALVVRSFKDWLNWWGYPFLFAGIFSIALSALSRLLAAWAFQVIVAPVLPETIPADFINVFKDLFSSIVQNAVQPTILIAGILTLIGLSMVAIAFLFQKQIQKSHVYKP